MLVLVILQLPPNTITLLVFEDVKASLIILVEIEVNDSAMVSTLVFESEILAPIDFLFSVV